MFRTENINKLLVCAHDDIEKPRVAVRKMIVANLQEVTDFEMMEGQMKLQKLNKEIVHAFFDEIVVHVKERVEIKWKFRDELLF